MRVQGDGIASDDGTGSARRPAFMQRQALKGLFKQARKHPDEPLTPADWESYWRYTAQPSNRAFKRVLRALPSTPRCGYCGAPFAGVGAWLVRPLGYRPSRKNPNICSMCVELAPPGGMTLEIGVLFADLRGFTSDSESRTPAEVSIKLRRFYAHAEKVFFPEALIDKLIGDEVMALYVPTFMMPAASIDDDARRHIAHVMLEHARELLERVGYGTAVFRNSRSASDSTSVRRSSGTSETPRCTTSQRLAMSSTQPRACRATRPPARSCCPLGSLGSFRNRSACPSRSCSRASRTRTTSAACDRS